MFVITTAIAIFSGIPLTGCISCILNGGTRRAHPSPPVAALLTVGFKILLTIWTLAIGRETKNTASWLWDMITEMIFLSALAATIGIFGRSGHPGISGRSDGVFDHSAHRR
ncbi:MAG: hypothetical protein R2861_14750 [Desulfobacterales bacterium]